MGSNRLPRPRGPVATADGNGGRDSGQQAVREVVVRMVRLSQRRHSLSFGPRRYRRIVLSIWVPMVFMLTFPLRPVTPVGLLMIGTAAVVLCRSWQLALIRLDGTVLIRNFFRTERLDLDTVQAAVFRSPRVNGVDVPLLLMTKSKRVIVVDGVSAWSRVFPGVAGDNKSMARAKARVNEFLAGTNVIRAGGPAST